MLLHSRSVFFLWVWSGGWDLFFFYFSFSWGWVWALGCWVHWGGYAGGVQEAHCLFTFRGWGFFKNGPSRWQCSRPLYFRLWKFRGRPLVFSLVVLKVQSVGRIFQLNGQRAGRLCSVSSWVCQLRVLRRKWQPC